MDSVAEEEGPLPSGVMDPDAAFSVRCDHNIVQLVLYTAHALGT